MCTTDAYGDLCRHANVWPIIVWVHGTHVFSRISTLNKADFSTTTAIVKAYAKYFYFKHLIGRKKFMVLPFREKKTHLWIWLKVNSCMANGTKLPFQVQPARSPLILTSTKTSDSAYFCRGKKMEENCSLRLQPFTFSHEIIQSSFIHQNNGHYYDWVIIISFLPFFNDI